MAEKLIQHRHCQVCLKAIPIGEEFCNEECKDKWARIIKANKKKNLIWMMMMMLFALFAIIMISNL
jgi:predicted nucleic acid-binding Zn ribbon protein